MLFGALALVPSVRGYAMTYTGIGSSSAWKRLPTTAHSRLMPDRIILGQTREIEVWGSGLRPEGSAPTENRQPAGAGKRSQ